MHPLLTDLRTLLRYLLAWLVTGGGLAALLWAGGLAAPAWALAFTLPLCVVFAFVALSAYYLCRGMPVAQRTLSLSLATLGGATLLVALGWLGVGIVWNSVGVAFGRGAGLVAMTRPAWVAFFALGVGFYVVSILAHDVLLASGSARQAAAREERAHGLARESELQLLRTQIHPHFLFNSLNSISALTSIDPAGAREMTIALAQFFRMTLALADRDRITLAEEVALCEHYLAIEKRRLGAKLLSALRLDASTRSAIIPPLVLQPLIENAIKHGIRQPRRAGRGRAGGVGARRLAAPAPGEPGAGPDRWRDRRRDRAGARARHGHEQPPRAPGRALWPAHALHRAPHRHALRRGDHVAARTGDCRMRSRIVAPGRESAA